MLTVKMERVAIKYELDRMIVSEGMEDVLPVMCNCDHIAMQKLHASLIREGTCVESPCCDYCIVGDRHPLAQGYELVRKENGPLVSVRKQASGIREED